MSTPKNCHDCINSNPDNPPDFCDRAEEEGVEEFWEEMQPRLEAGETIDCIFCPGFEEEDT